MSSKKSKFFSVRTGTNRNSICFGCFSVCFAKPKTFFSFYFSLFRCFGPVLKQSIKTEFCRNKPKKSPKNIIYKGVLENINFFSRFEPKQTNQNSICFGLFGLLFHETPQKNFRFVLVCFNVSDQYRNNRNKQNLWYGEFKRLIF